MRKGTSLIYIDSDHEKSDDQVWNNFISTKDYDKNKEYLVEYSSQDGFSIHEITNIY